MERFARSVEAALIHNNWYCALAISLTLPDICGRLENPKDGSKERYIKWWDSYVLSKYQSVVGALGVVHIFLSGRDAYALRCAYLHEGTDGIEEQRAREVLSRIHFIAPVSGQTIHNNQENSVLQLQVDIFCKDICAGVDQWSVDVSNNRDIQGRKDSLIVIQEPRDGVLTIGNMLHMRID